MFNFLGGGGGDEQLKLDVIVDDHGGVQKLADVDAGVNKVVTSAKAGAPSLDALNAQFAEARARLDVLSASAGQAGPALLSAGAIAGGVAAAGALALAAALRATVEDATDFTAAAEQIGGDAAKFSRVARAADEVSVSEEKLVGVMDQLNDRIASGKIDGGLRQLGFALAKIKAEDPSDQLHDIAVRIGEIEDPADRAHARLMLLGNYSPEAARLMKQAFADAAEGAKGMSRESIEAFNSIGTAWEQLKARIASAPSTIFGMSFDAFLEMRRALGTSPDAPPTPPQAPPKDLPAGPQAMADPEFVEAHIRQLEIERQITEEFYRQDEVFRNIAEAQAMVVKSGGDWSDVLEKRVGTAVDAINAKYVQAVLMNNQLAGNAQASRDRILTQLTATTDPNASEYDKRFNAIDQDMKARLAAVDQNDRVSAAEAENKIYEDINAQIELLNRNWESVNRTLDDQKPKIDTLKASYDDLTKTFSPAGGVALPAGLTAPTAEQLATGRYFGPVTPNGQPDYARFGGAAPISVQVPVNAQGAFLDNPQNIDRLVRMVTKGVMEDPTLNRLVGRR